MINIKEATLKELVAQRPDLVQAIKNGEDEGTTSSYVEKDEKKRVKKWIGETRDINGNLLSKRVDEYSYYETGEVDTIILQVYDDKGKLTSEKSVRHFKDGKKPEVTKSKAKIMK
jgi:hypothetical protein